MQYGGPNQQQRILNMMMQARQQQAARQRQSAASIYSSYPALPNQHPQGLHQRPPQQKELPYVTSLAANDVLLGRGTPCAENEGNVRFRRLVKQRKMEYIAAEKRIRKDAIAREILEVIASRGGRFLRKVESKSELNQLGVPPGVSYKEVWAMVDEDTQVQKVKQALRNKDDALDLPPPSEGEEALARASYNEQDTTNRFPRGVNDESNIHKADCNLQFGTGVLERASSGSDGEVKGSPKLKGLEPKGIKSPAGAKKTSTKFSKLASETGSGFLSAGDRRFSGGIGDMQHAARIAASVDMASPQRNLLALDAQRLPGGLPPPPGAMAGMLHRDAWENSKAAPSEGELRTLQELQRLRMMREQMGVNPALGVTGGLPSAGAGGLDGAGMYGPEYRGLVSAEYRQMQAQQLQAQQLQAQRMAAAREHAAALRGVTPSLHPSAAMAARQLQLESQAVPRRLSAGALGGPQAAVRRLPASSLGGLAQEKRTHGLDAAGGGASSIARGRAGADSAGERAIGIAQAMKRAEAFSPTESLELSQLETLILSALCSHGMPVWTPEAQTKAFVDVPAFASKRLDWSWCDFASLLRKNASQKKKEASPEEARIAEFALGATTEYLADPRELATKTIMLMERLRRHSSAGTTQRKQWSGLGMRVPLWLDRELSRWAMSLGNADPTGRPVPFSATDFAAEHPGYTEDPSIVATAAFDPQLADDVVDQVALLTRLRSVFAKSKGVELHAQIEVAAKKASAAGDGWQDQPKGWESGEISPASREVLLCDRLLKDGFAGVVSSVSDLGSDYQLASNATTRPCSSFGSMGLTKSTIQQRVNQVTRELHIQDESRDMQDLLGGRMERIAQAVLRSGSTTARQQPVTTTTTALHLLAGAGNTETTTSAAVTSLKKRRTSSSGSEGSSSKKAKK